MPHEELIKLAVQMRISGEKLAHEYNVLFQTCNTQMKLMGEQAENAVNETIRYVLCMPNTHKFQTSRRFELSVYFYSEQGF